MLTKGISRARGAVAKLDPPDVGELAGAGMVSLGFGVIHISAGLIVGGLFVLGGSVATRLSRKGATA